MHAFGKGLHGRMKLFGSMLQVCVQVQGYRRHGIDEMIAMCYLSHPGFLWRVAPFAVRFTSIIRVWYGSTAAGSTMTTLLPADEFRGTTVERQRGRGLGVAR